MFADVTSANIVGYQNNDWLGTTFYMMGMQFEKTDGKPVKLSEINFGNMVGPKYDDDFSFTKTAPQIQISMANSETFHPTYYFLADGAPDFTNPGWTDAVGNPISDDIVVDAGIGFWFRDPVSDKPTFKPAGQVMPDSPWSKTFSKVDYFMLVNPFPMDTALSDISFSDLEKSAPYYSDDDAWLNTATQLQVPFANREGFTAYYFLADGNETYDGPGWVDQGGNNVDITKIVIPADAPAAE